MIVYDPKALWSIILHWNGSALKESAPYVLLAIVWSACAIAISGTSAPSVGLTTHSLQGVVFVAGFTLASKMEASYGRYTDAIACVVELEKVSMELMRQTAVIIDTPNLAWLRVEIRRALLAALLAVVVDVRVRASMGELTFAMGRKVLKMGIQEGLLDDKVSAVPIEFIPEVVSIHIERKVTTSLLYDKKYDDWRSKMNADVPIVLSFVKELDNHFTQLNQTATEMRTLSELAYPMFFCQMSRVLWVICVISLPYNLRPDFGYYAIVPVALFCIGYFSAELIACHLDNPFGVHDHSVSIDNLLTRIEVGSRVILEISHGDKPDQYNFAFMTTLLRQGHSTPELRHVSRLRRRINVKQGPRGFLMPALSDDDEVDPQSPVGAAVQRTQRGYSLDDLPDIPSQHRKGDPTEACLGMLTWNLSECLPLEVELAAALERLNASASKSTGCGVIAIATQECKQISLNPFGGAGKQISNWQARCAAALRARGMVALAFDCLGATTLGVFIHRDLFHFVALVESSSIPCGPGGVLVNKGGVAIAFTLFGERLCFLSSHLAAHENKALARHADYCRITNKIFSSDYLLLLSAGNLDSDDSDEERVARASKLNVSDDASVTSDAAPSADTYFGSRLDGPLPPSNMSKRRLSPRGGFPKTAKVASNVDSVDMHASYTLSKNTGGLPNSEALDMSSSEEDCDETSAAAWYGVDSRRLLDNFDAVFWAGDLNYRVDGRREEVEENVDLAFGLNGKDVNPYAHKWLTRRDQLSKARKAGHVFVGYAEGQLMFRPTFKFDTGKDTYDTSEKQRIPSWCDRILYKPGKTRLVHYSSVSAVRHGDHRPVFATFDIDLGSQ